MSSKTVTLRIKKKYFNLIADGHKTTEYRNLTKFYYNMLRKNPTKLKLHYQGDEILTVPIKSINVIPNVFERESRPSCLTTDFIYEINLG
jgi:hypothetical protein